jgi:hypothetical protein
LREVVAEAMQQAVIEPATHPTPSPPPTGGTHMRVGLTEEEQRQVSEDYAQRRRDGLESEDRPELWELLPPQMSGAAGGSWLRDMMQAAQEYEDEMFSEEDETELEPEYD